jgi:hypothetical protein
MPHGDVASRNTIQGLQMNAAQAIATPFSALENGVALAATVLGGKHAQPKSFLVANHMEIIP